MSTRVGKHTTTLLLVGLLTLGAGPAAAAGGKPVITKGGGTETFADDLFLDLFPCAGAESVHRHPQILSLLPSNPSNSGQVIAAVGGLVESRG